jgi:hypothetical protein
MCWSHVYMFMIVLQQILQRTGKLFERGSDLESHPHANQEAVTQLMGKVKHLMGDFDRRLSFRKKKLNDSVRLHQLTEAVSSLSTPLSLSCSSPPPLHTLKICGVYERAVE